MTLFRKSRKITIAVVLVAVLAATVHSQTPSSSLIPLTVRVDKLTISDTSKTDPMYRSWPELTGLPDVTTWIDLANLDKAPNETLVEKRVLLPTQDQKLRGLGLKITNSMAVQLMQAATNIDSEKIDVLAGVQVLTVMDTVEDAETPCLKSLVSTDVSLSAVIDAKTEKAYVVADDEPTVEIGIGNFLAALDTDNSPGSIEYENPATRQWKIPRLPTCTVAIKDLLTKNVVMRVVLPKDDNTSTYVDMPMKDFLNAKAREELRKVMVAKRSDKPTDFVTSVVAAYSLGKQLGAWRITDQGKIEDAGIVLSVKGRLDLSF